LIHFYKRWILTSKDQNNIWQCLLRTRCELCSTSWWEQRGMASWASPGQLRFVWKIVKMLWCPQICNVWQIKILSQRIYGFSRLTNKLLFLKITLKSLKILFGKAITEDFKLYEMLQYIWVRILKWLIKNQIAGVWVRIIS